MVDLEKLIADKQDALRGRRRDWIDEVKDWSARTDWAVISLVLTVGILAAIGLSL
jgi:hypothetical protein